MKRRLYITTGVSMFSLALGMAFAASTMPSGLALAIALLAGGAIGCFHRAGVL